MLEIKIVLKSAVVSLQKNKTKKQGRPEFRSALQ